MTTPKRSNCYHNLRIPLERFSDFFFFLKRKYFEVANGYAEVHKVTETSNLTQEGCLEAGVPLNVSLDKK